MSAVREPAAAGRFYPASPGVLLRTVDRLLAEAEATPPAGELRALVVPHAGYDYSGAVAASAFAAVPRSVLRVALLGPSHFVPLQRPAVSTARAWRTPLGVVPVDRELRDAAVASGAVEDERPHRYDHALEVELPFLQRRSGTGLRILPVAAGGGTRPIASVVAAVAADALIVVSSDLSHGLDDAAARARDQRTADAIATLDDATIDDGAACGAPALRGLLAHARRAGWECTPLDLRTSADATGSCERVVGYGAFVFTERVVERDVVADADRVSNEHAAHPQVTDCRLYEAEPALGLRGLGRRRALARPSSQAAAATASARPPIAAKIGVRPDALSTRTSDT